MSRVKKSLSDFFNKDEFNFNIKDGKIVFETLYNKQKNKIRYWKGYIELYNDKVLVDIKPDYISDYKFNESYFTLYMTSSGLIDGKETILAPTSILEGKNIGKKNETNVLTQALITVRSLYLKKNNSGYITETEYKNNNNEINNQNNSILPFPMSLNIYEKHKNKIEYPCYIQPKLDGIRLIAHIKNNEVIFTSRRLNEIYGFDNIKKELEKLNLDETFYMDGELYTHGMSLQDISSIVRNEKEDKENESLLKFYIFDCFDTEAPDVSFNERIEYLREIIKLNNFKFIEFVPTTMIYSEKEGDKLFKTYIDNEYEGIVYKNTDAIYEFSFNKEKRSMNYLKRKVNFTDEYTIMDFTEGKGSHKGCIIFTLITKNNKIFNCTPNWTLYYRKKMYKQALKNFEIIFLNKKATVSYDDLSDDGVPLRAHIITIRDYE